MMRYLDGDSKAFETVYRRRRDGLGRFLERQCGSRELGRELAQEVWFKLIRACQNGQYTGDGKFTTFLYRVAKNQVIDWYRKHGHIKTVELYDTVESGDGAEEIYNYHVDNPEKILADKEKVDALIEGMDSLSEEQRTTLLMQLEGNLSYDEIAEAMDTKRETVKTRLRYARQHLKARIFTDD